MGATKTQDLLESPDGNGNCQAWSGLFRDVLRLNGLFGQRKALVHDNGRYYGYTVLVNNWSFEATPLITPPTWAEYPYTKDVDAKPTKILPGQGNPDTPDGFNGHWVTLWNDIPSNKFYYFDPSYGSSVISHSDEAIARKQYEDGALAGYSDGVDTTNQLHGVRVRKNNISSGSPEVSSTQD
jgi:hypothetical protein